jgi:predicted nuclease with TOPRIM domain
LRFDCCAGGAGKEIDMDAEGQEGSKRKYSTPARVQAWFLGRSRDGWKSKYKELRRETKRLENRVNDVTRSREMWRERVAQLEKENAALREQAALKKSGRCDDVFV